MRLYYMTTLQTLEAYILPEMRIRLSTFGAVNDPFELLAIRHGGRDERRRFAWLYDYWVGVLGFVSFSESWKSPLMWAHYAENHTGVCLGIEVPDGLALKVSYEPERLHLVLDTTKLETAVDPEIIRTIVTTKFKEWEYEREWRVVKRLGDSDPVTGLHYVQFTPDFELREVILGARCTRRPGQIRKQVFGNTGEITVKKVRPAFGAFSMVQQQRSSQVKISALHRVSL